MTPITLYLFARELFERDPYTARKVRSMIPSEIMDNILADEAERTREAEKYLAMMMGLIGMSR